MKLYNGLPLYKVVIDLDDERLGMDAISLVDDPAVGDLFLKFSKEHKLIQFTADEEKHIITGVALSCNLPIYRVFDGEECYVTFDKETIEKLVLDYSRKNLFNSVNLQHDDNTFQDGIYMIESYFVNRERGIAPKEFDDIDNGSYIVSYKVVNDELWNEIKNSGDLNGFSIQGFFDLEPAEEKEYDIEDIFNSLFVQERDIRGYIDDRKQLEITENGNTYKGQIYSLGKTDGKRSCILQNNDRMEWKVVLLDDIEKIKQLDTEIAAWQTDSPSFNKIMEDESTTTEKTISAPVNTIDWAIDNNAPVMISYFDGENSDGRGFRQCIIGAYGFTRKGNECIRVYQYYGASHSDPGGSGIWRLLLTKRIVNFQVIEGMEPVLEAPYGFNAAGDDGMGTVMKVAEFLY